MHFVHGQRVTPMFQTLGPFISGINWESQYLGQVTTRYLLPVSHLRPRLYVETKTSVSPRSSPLGTFREEERLRLSDRNSILMT